MIRLSRYAAALGLAMLAPPLAPQGASNRSADPVIRVTVDLVQLDAVVTDSQGHHVPDLKPADFQILEDGRPQKITHFSYVQGDMPSASARPAPNRHEEALREEASIAAMPLQREQVRRTIVMIADDLGLSSDDIPNVRKAMKSFVDREMRSGDLVSVMTTSGGMGIVAQLTNDKRQLYAAIDRIHYVAGRIGQTWYEPTNIGDTARRVQVESNTRLNAIRSPAQVIDTQLAVGYAIQGLHDMPGRKAIALFSDGFNQSPGQIVELANRASVVLYTFDARGLPAFFLTAVDVCASCAGAGGPRRIRAAEAGREATYRASQRSLDEMARGTGGIFFHDNNDLIQGLAAALDDMSSYYLIGYQPGRDDFENVRGQPRFHKIEVKILRAGLKVRSRDGFVGTPDPPPVPEQTSPQSVKEDLRKALFSPFHANGFPVHLSVFYSAAPRIDPKTRRRRALLRAMLAIDAHGLTFRDGPDGKKQVNLDVLAAAYGADNEVVTSSDRTFSPSMTADEMDQIVASGLVYGLDVEAPKPGPYQFRVAVRDANSGRLGSAALFVEIPDFNRPGIVLSSVQLYDSDAQRNEELARAGVMGAGSAVTRMFASGATLRYDCAVYGSLIDPQTGKPQIDSAVSLFRGPERIYTGQPVPLEVSKASSAPAIHAFGKIALPAGLPPGDYALQLTVSDRLETKQRQSASQWVDFTLVP
jgi:VWFA-related protein